MKSEVYAYQTDSIRDLEKYIKENSIEKDSIVTIFQDNRNNEFVLIYYK